MANIFGQINTTTDIETLVGANRIMYPTVNLQGIVDGGSGAYYYGLESKEIGGTQTLTITSIGSTEKYGVGYLSNPFESGYNTIPKGNFRVFITAKQDSGTRTVTMYAKIYKVSLGGTETLLLTTNSTSNLTASYALYEVDVASSAISILATDRIAVKFYLIGSASGTDAAVSIRIGTTALEHVEIPSSFEINSYTRQTGWIAFPVTWTRTGNYTFTLTNDWTTFFRKGTKIRYKDGGSYEYGVVGSSSFASTTTTVTLITNTDYAMAAATITDTYISYATSPEGFPATFNWTPTVTYAGGTTDPTSVTIDSAKWSTTGTLISFVINATLTRGTGNRVYTLFSLPNPINFTITYPATGLNNGVGGVNLNSSILYTSGTDLVNLHGAMINSGNYYLAIVSDMP